jgi:hypothetical protein
MLVARFTNNPIGDIKRGWSGYMGCAWETLEEAADFFGIYENEDGEYDIEKMMEDHDIRFDTDVNLYREVHHDGLSCWKLQASTIEEAIEEAKTAGFEWSGFGQATKGTVKYVCAVEGIEDLHIFECKDIVSE